MWGLNGSQMLCPNGAEGVAVPEGMGQRGAKLLRAALHLAMGSDGQGGRSLVVPPSSVLKPLLPKLPPRRRAAGHIGIYSPSNRKNLTLQLSKACLQFFS